MRREMSDLMNKNDVFEVNIDAWSSDGGGICRVDGMAVFVAGAAKGDRCRIRILKTARTHAFAKIEQLLEPSALRVDAGCEVFGKCGGCALRHIGYDAELEFKRERVADALERIGGVKCEVAPTLAAPSVDGARNKATYQLERDADGHLRAGFFRRRSNDVIACSRCPSLPEAADAAARAVEAASRLFDLGEARWLMWRGNSFGESQLVLVTRDRRARRAEGFSEFLRERLPEMVSLVHLHNPRNDNVILAGEPQTLYGSDTLREVICGAEFDVSPLSFLQTNRAQAERLYALACEFADAEGERVLELYCGIGTMTLALARSAREVVGCEIVPAAVENAKLAARKNGVENVSFVCADAGELAAREADGSVASGARSAVASGAADVADDCASGEPPYGVIVVDPPRKGLSAEALDAVVRLAPKRVVYVSCDPATLARDAKLLAASGYAAARVQPVDMFPRTEHVETVAKFERTEICR